MNKELQDKTWSILPKEFKEEIRQRFLKSGNSITTESCLLKELFGNHNITSDIKETEVLYASRKQVRQIYEYCRRERCKDWKDTLAKAVDETGIQLIQVLFGDSTCSLNGSNPWEIPKKYDRGQKCKIIGGKGAKKFIGQIVTLTSFIPEDNAWAAMFPNGDFIFLTEDDLEPASLQELVDEIEEKIEEVRNK